MEPALGLAGIRRKVMAVAGRESPWPWQESSARSPVKCAGWTTWTRLCGKGRECVEEIPSSRWDVDASHDPYPPAQGRPWSQERYRIERGLAPPTRAGMQRRPAWPAVYAV